MNTEHQSANSPAGTAEQRDRRDRAPTTEKLAEVAHEAVDKAAARSAEAERAARHTAERTREKAFETASTAQQASQDALQSVTAYTQRKPLSALGVAFAAGIMFSALLRR